MELELDKALEALVADEAEDELELEPADEDDEMLSLAEELEMTPTIELGIAEEPETDEALKLEADPEELLVLSLLDDGKALLDAEIDDTLLVDRRGSLLDEIAEEAACGSASALAENRLSLSQLLDS